MVEFGEWGRQRRTQPGNFGPGLQIWPALDRAPPDLLADTGCAKRLRAVGRWGGVNSGRAVRAAPCVLAPGAR